MVKKKQAIKKILILFKTLFIRILSNLNPKISNKIILRIGVTSMKKEMNLGKAQKITINLNKLLTSQII